MLFANLAIDCCTLAIFLLLIAEKSTSESQLIVLYGNQSANFDSATEKTNTTHDNEPAESAIMEERNLDFLSNVTHVLAYDLDFISNSSHEVFHAFHDNQSTNFGSARDGDKDLHFRSNATYAVVNDNQSAIFDSVREGYNHLAIGSNATRGVSNKIRRQNTSIGLLSSTQSNHSFNISSESTGESNKKRTRNASNPQHQTSSKISKEKLPRCPRINADELEQKNSPNNMSTIKSSADRSDMMVIATAVTKANYEELETMLIDLSEYSPSITVVVFNFGLSNKNQAKLEENFSCIFRPAPALAKKCRFPCRSQLVYSLLPQYDIIVWADVGFLPKVDFRQLLDDFPVGSTFIGHRATSKLPKPVSSRTKHRASRKNGTPAAGLRLVSTRFFALLVDFRFYSRVLLPWKRCSLDPRCPIAPSIAKQASALRRSSTDNSWDDVLLTLLLTAFEAAHKGSVLLDTRAKLRAPKPQKERQPSPAIPRLGPRPDEPLMACLPIYGPNNQVVMLLHCAWLAARLGARLLVPPLRPHYLKTDRANVTQDPANLPPDGLFSAHFLYRRAVLADGNSSWDDVLPSLDLVTTNPRSIPACAAGLNCTVAALLRHRYLAGLLTSVGAHRTPGAAVRVVSCRTDPEACARASLAAHRVPLLVWNTIYLLRTRRDSFPTLRSGFFRVPRAVLARGLEQPRACLAIHLRLKDRATPRRYNATGDSDPDLMRAPTRDVLIHNDWGDRSLAAAIAVARRAARRRGLALYVMMPYNRPVFEELRRLGARTVQDHDVAGLSELEVTLADMALGAGCEVFVRDEGSTLSDVVASMAGGVGVMNPSGLLREDAAA